MFPIVFHGLLSYCLQDGSWNVPYELIKRYSEELNKRPEEIIKEVEELRKDECTKAKLPFVSVVMFTRSS